MTLTELRYVLAVARERHFGRAADSCFVSQPTLSVGIKKLEEELGITIFERSATEVSVTPIGSRIVEQAARVLEETNAIKHIAAQSQDQLEGPLRLGLIYTIAPYLLPHLIPSLHQLAPRMPLIIQENYTAVLTEQLRQGELDAIILALPFQLPGIETSELYDEPFVVAMPLDHAWTKRKSIKAEDLAEETLLLLGPGHCFRDQVLKLCPECQRSAQLSTSLQKSLEGSSLETIRYMVASGAGITVLPQTSVTPTMRNTLLATRPFVSPAPSRRTALAWRKSFPRPEAIRIMKKAVNKCALEGITSL